MQAFDGRPRNCVSRNIVPGPCPRGAVRADVPRQARTPAPPISDFRPEHQHDPDRSAARRERPQEKLRRLERDAAERIAREEEGDADGI